ncbi:MAG: DUF72 domain-containing protein [Gammaproteobacteria bacterium]|nr:DUF72 domain-containing protein [Gammaproteobacteria bacterium]
MIHDSTTMSEQSCYGLRTGSYGWRHQHWHETFYPDDLPEDWQLGYYANEFPAVMVPQSYWQAGTGFNLASWPDDVPPHFRFYIEWPAHMDASSEAYCLEECRRLGSLLGGVIVQQDRLLEVGWPVYHRQQVWTPDHYASSGVAIVSLADMDMRTQRKYLEQFAASTEHPQCVLVSDADINIEALRNFKTLIELLGL